LEKKIDISKSNNKISSEIFLKQFFVFILFFGFSLQIIASCKLGLQSVSHFSIYTKIKLLVSRKATRKVNKIKTKKISNSDRMKSPF